MASFLVGLQTDGQLGFGVPQSTHGNIYVGYAGDNWKISPKLTVDLGLQYVYASPPMGNQTSLMDINLAHTQPLATDFAFAYLWGEKNPITGAAPNTSQGNHQPGPQ